MMDLTGFELLVVDDDESARELLREALESHGAVVRTAASAAQARTALARRRPDVIISDIGMPDEDGCELIRTIRLLPRASGGDVPAIAFTANSGADTRAHALACGFQIVLTKPLPIGKLVATIVQVGEMAERLPLDNVGPVARDS